MNIKVIIRKADVILEVMDARMPEITRNERLELLVKKLGKTLIRVINKIDIVSKEAAGSLRLFPGSVLVSSKTREGISALLSTIPKNSKVAVIGYPNTGKSSLINVLSKGGKARTSPESGFTKGVQLISGKNGIMLLDTPGIIPINGVNDELRLGLVSGISPSKLVDPDLVAHKLISIFQKANKNALRRYGLDPDSSPEEILLDFGKKRNMFQKGGIVDEKRAAINLLREWHSGKIRL